MDVAMNGSLQDISTCRPPLTVSVERESEWLHSGRPPESGGHKRRSSDPTAKRFCRERRDGAEPNVVPVYIQRTYTAHHRNSLRTDETTSTQKKRERRGAKPGLFATDV